MLVSLPMYVVSPEANEALWQWLRQDVISQLSDLDQALVPDNLSHPDDLHTHWKQADLLMSQTCGFPLMTELYQKVQLIGSFEYDVPYADGIECKSVLICRDDDQAKNLTDFQDRTVAFNSLTSQSGYNSLRHLIAPLSKNGQFFKTAYISGGHKASIEAVQQKKADLAAIDCVTFEGLKRYGGDTCKGLRIIANTHAYPGLPLISGLHTPQPLLDALKNSLSRMHLQTELKPVLQTLMIKKWSPSFWSTYQVCLEMQEQALAQNYTKL